MKAGTARRWTFGAMLVSLAAGFFTFHYSQMAALRTELQAEVRALWRVVGQLEGADALQADVRALGQRVGQLEGKSSQSAEPD